jgi:hypothetical protein
MSANAVLASALGVGCDELSPRDCLVCLAYLYASGATATTQIKAAITSGLDALSTRDLEICLAAEL